MHYSTLAIYYILIFLIPLLIAMLPYIIIGYTIKYKEIIYIVIIWIIAYITASITKINELPMSNILDNIIYSFHYTIKALGLYIPLGVIGLLIGSYAGRNNQKWKLSNKIPIYLTIIIISVFPLFWYIIVRHVTN